MVIVCRAPQAQSETVTNLTPQPAELTISRLLEPAGDPQPKRYRATPWRIRALNALLPQGFGRWRLDSAEALEAAARRAVPTQQELTADTRTALHELLRSFKSSAQLHPLGEITMAVNVLSLLQNQLGISQAFAADPSIATRKITAPVIITGLPRTGSTLLHNLLALDPQLRVPVSWEVNSPTPLPNTSRRKRQKVRLTQRRFALIERLHPGFRAIHELDAHLPQECLVIMASALRSHLFFSSSFVPGYQDWLDSQPAASAYDIHRKTLQLLQGPTIVSARDAAPPVTWALKAPSHLLSIDGLLATYPDSKIIYTRRAPEKVVGSIASLQWHLYRTFSNFTDTRELGAQVNRRWGAAYSHFEARLRSDRALRERVTVVNYSSFVAKPIETIEDIYAKVNLSLNDPVASIMRAYLQRRPQHRFGTHEYTLDDYALSTQDVRDAFATDLHHSTKTA